MIRHWSALLRFYFKVEPDELSDDKWCELVGELQYALKWSGKIENYG